MSEKWQKKNISDVYLNSYAAAVLLALALVASLKNTREKFLFIQCLFFCCFTITNCYERETQGTTAMENSCNCYF